MCANCVNKFDVVVGSMVAAGYLFKRPMQDGMVGLGLAPEPHPLAVDMRTVNFLRSLDLDPAPILGDDVVAAVDQVQAFPQPRVYRRTFRAALALLVPGSRRSQRALATR
jgi:hypothetical protein